MTGPEPARRAGGGDLMYAHTGLPRDVMLPQCFCRSLQRNTSDFLLSFFLLSVCTCQLFLRRVSQKNKSSNNKYRLTKLD